MLIKFEQNPMVQITRNFWAFWQKAGVLKPFWQSVDAILEDVSVAVTTV